jgi:hypothetical protein
VRLSSERAATEEFHKHTFINTWLQVRYEAKTLSRLNNLDNAPKPLKRLNPVNTRNGGLKSGFAEPVRNYMSMARELNCDMFQSA